MMTQEDLDRDAAAVRAHEDHDDLVDGCEACLEAAVAAAFRPTLSEQEALANLLRIGRPGNVGRSVAYRLVSRGWATYTVRTGAWTLTELGYGVLRKAAAR